MNNEPHPTCALPTRIGNPCGNVAVYRCPAHGPICMNHVYTSAQPGAERKCRACYAIVTNSAHEASA